MNLTVTRDTFTENSVTGLMGIDGIFQCYTLELPWSVDGQTNVPGKTCIPNGTYRIKLAYSDKHQCTKPFILDVPNRTAIEIDVANFPKQLLGCTAVGQSRSAEVVWQSELAFGALMAKLETDADNLKITYSGTPRSTPSAADLDAHAEQMGIQAT